jgi:hypothetical protein
MNIVKATYSKDYMIEFEFSDGKITQIDFKLFLFHSSNPLIKQFQRKSLFKHFVVKPRYIDWANDMGFSATDLYTGKI